MLPGRHTQGTPAVRYRGFFINDENPQTGTWAPGLFGQGKASGYPAGLNHLYYEKVFEVMLRLKANYLWPAVWGRAFAEDDPDNHATAKRYGVVMGTSHEAPMMRGIEEWNRHPKAYGGTGEWSFVRNADAIKAYWRDGIRRMRQQDFEGVVTLGMRGNGDTSLPDGGGIDLMRQIIASQRQILTEEAGRPVTQVPQVWTLYKEVQRYWDQGLRPPDDVTVLFTDDNWGNMRKLPDQSLPVRAGGYGMYYHFDYVGGSRSYKWADTISLANTWEQLHTSYAYGVDRLWVANVGDLKNMERPTQFFLDYAWNPAALTADRIGDWERQYAAQNFGTTAAPAVADVLHTYGQLQARRKPESTNRKMTRGSTGTVTTDDTTTPFSIENYDELDRVTTDWQALATRADAVRATLPPADQDAYYQLVLYPVKATANLYALRRAQFLNRRYWNQGRAATNDLATTAEARLADDQAMSNYYNTTLTGGKWRGWQTETKIGYGDKDRYGSNASWSPPPQPDQIYPQVHRITVPGAAEMGVGDLRLTRLVAGLDRVGDAADVLPLPNPTGAVHRGVQPRCHRLRLQHQHGGTMADGHARHRLRREAGACDGARRLDEGAARHDEGSDHRDRRRADRHGRRRGGQSGEPALAAVRLRRSERLCVDGSRPLHHRRLGQRRHLATDSRHRPHRLRHDAGSADRGRANPRRHRTTAGIPDEPHHRGAGHRLDLPCSAQQRPLRRRHPLRGLDRQSVPDNRERHGGRRRHRHERSLGHVHRRRRQSHRHDLHRVHARRAHAEALDGGPDHGRAETGRRHRRTRRQLPRATGELPRRPMTVVPPRHAGCR